MRIVCVAGFFNPVKTKIDTDFHREIETNCVIWVPQVSTGELNQNKLKQALFDAVGKGANEILIVAFILRGYEYLRDIIASLIEEAKHRLPSVRIIVHTSFKNARDAEGVVALVRDFGPARAKVYPETIIDLSQWVLTNYREKIVLHARAIRSSCRSQFEDVRLIYQAVELLGTEYYAMRTTSVDEANRNRSVCNARLAQLGLELAPTISASRAGEQGDEYMVLYPPGTEFKRELDLHLKKGSDRDQRHCLRIYFFWDDDGKTVVIGWLPSHLDTRAT